MICDSAERNEPTVLQFSEHAAHSARIVASAFLVFGGEHESGLSLCASLHVARFHADSEFLRFRGRQEQKRCELGTGEGGVSRSLAGLLLRRVAGGRSKTTGRQHAALSLRLHRAEENVFCAAYRIEVRLSSHSSLFIALASNAMIPIPSKPRPIYRDFLLSSSSN